MIKTYCTADNASAIITVRSGEDIYQAEFRNPPLKVEIHDTSKLAYLVDTYNDNAMKFRTVFPGSWLWGTNYQGIYAFCTGGDTILYAGQSGGSNRIDSVFFDESKHTGFCQVPHRYYYEAITTDSKMICAYTSTAFYGWEVQDNFTYSVKCDGCPPGDCKASKAKYPGYQCIDCQELESRLINIGRKIDGI